MKKIITLFLFTVIISCVTVMIYFKEVTTVKFFPIDPHVSFSQADTSIEQMNPSESNEFTYAIHSNSSQKTFLRQDISLLFGNGMLIGMLHCWEQNIDDISLKENFTLPMSSYLHAISFHHGEIHPENEEAIYSMQQMSFDSLYAMMKEDKLTSFKNPTTPLEAEFAHELSTKTEHTLSHQWQNLEQYFDINAADYERFPLTNIHKLTEQGIPGKSTAETAQIIGQLWEGIYREYILLLSNKNKQLSVTYVPSVLFAKDQTHLLVLFEIDDQKHKLIQRFP